MTQGIPDKLKAFPWVYPMLGFLLLILAAGVFLISTRWEGRAPSLSLEPNLSLLGRTNTFQITASDEGTGLKSLRAEIRQGKRTVELLHESYPEVRRRVSKTLHIDPRALHLQEGPGLLRLEARDRSWRGEGNIASLERPIRIDITPPSLRILFRPPPPAQGEARLLIYSSSEEIPRHGILVGDLRFPGRSIPKKRLAAFFAVPLRIPSATPVVLQGEDEAGNRSRVTLATTIHRRNRRRTHLWMDPPFLLRVVREFQEQDPSLPDDPLEAFLKINRDLREKTHRRVWELCRNSEPRKLWSGPFLRPKGVRETSTFGEDRVFVFQGKGVDQQDHMGVDLASIVNAPVRASNRGRVVFAGEMGIYGQTVLLDHGLGVFSMYGHMSRIDVETGQMVDRGTLLGRTGSTGLATGDHLHFSILISGVFVDPQPWWNPTWTDLLERSLKGENPPPKAQGSSH
jgi:murein DD-endopeptidase MepM/ murein hydrolase activator NlpD